MKFLVDAQLPRRLVTWLREQGHDAVHTLDLAEGNRTPDVEIIRVADHDGRVVVTKDLDFVHSFTRGEGPERLLLVFTGNVAKTEIVSR